MILAILLILGGRQVRTRMLLDDQGLWLENMWLDELVMPPGAMAANAGKKQKKVQLTDPLPINSCSVDSLTLLPGVGKIMAQRIEEARQEGLFFSCSADLRKIKGIGAMLSARLDTLVIYQIGAIPTKKSPDSSKILNSP